jgi:hypothetical protein
LVTGSKRGRRCSRIPRYTLVELLVVLTILVMLGRFFRFEDEFRRRDSRIALVTGATRMPARMR